MDELKRIREEIAKLLMHRDYEAGEVWCDWNSREPSAERVRESYREDADEILSLKGICVKAENQELPEVPDRYADYQIGYEQAQQDMLTPQDGCVWVRCEKEEHES